jgi:tRNA U38,U39,U40 pseudouridine synthase TruA
MYCSKKRTDKRKTVKVEDIDNLVIKLKCLYCIKGNSMHIRPYVFIHDKNDVINYFEATTEFKERRYAFLLNVHLNPYSEEMTVRVDKTEVDYRKIKSELMNLVDRDEFCRIFDYELEWCIKDNWKLNFDKIISRDINDLKDYQDILSEDIENYYDFDNYDIVIDVNELIKEYKRVKKLRKYQVLNDDKIVKYAVKEFLDIISEGLNKGLERVKDIYKNKYFLNELKELDYFEIVK